MADVQVKNSKLYLEMISKYNEQSIILKQAEPISNYIQNKLDKSKVHTSYQLYNNCIVHEQGVPPNPKALK